MTQKFVLSWEMFFPCPLRLGIKTVYDFTSRLSYANLCIYHRNDNNNFAQYIILYYFHTLFSTSSRVF